MHTCLGGCEVDHTSVGLRLDADDTPHLHRGRCLAQLNRPRSVVIAANSPRVGRLERAIRRHLILSERLTTTQLAQRIYRTTKPWQLGNVRRAAPKFAVEVGRRRSRGVPILWRLK
jgi:hypothetical protein